MQLEMRERIYKLVQVEVGDAMVAVTAAEPTFLSRPKLPLHLRLILPP